MCDVMLHKEALHFHIHKSIFFLSSGCEVRYHNGGHVSSHILNRTDIRQALADGMDKLLNVYNGNQSLAWELGLHLSVKVL